MQMYVARENPHFNADDVRAVAALRSSLIKSGSMKVPLLACKHLEP